MAEHLGDRVRHYFTINEFASFVEGGYQGLTVQVGGGKTVHLGAAPGLTLSGSELKQVRHHAVLGHGLAVEAIRAHGPAGTKVGFAENIRVAVPIMLSALLMFEKFAKALKVAVRDEGFAQILDIGLLLVIVGTITYTTSQECHMSVRPTYPSSTARTLAQASDMRQCSGMSPEAYCERL